MNPRVTGTLIGIMIAACLITGALVYPHLPLLVAGHWNAHGEVTGRASRNIAVFLLPGMMFALWGLWALLPNIDPIAPGFKGFRYIYDFIWVLLIAFLAYIYAFTLGVNLGWQVDTLSAILPALGVFFLISGALLPYIPRNWFIGIRTPWSLSSDRVWTATHRLGGKLFCVSGLCMIVAGFVSRPLAFWLAFAPLIIAIIWSVWYSYVVYKRQ